MTGARILGYGDHDWIGVPLCQILLSIWEGAILGEGLLVINISEQFGIGCVT